MSLNMNPLVTCVETSLPSSKAEGGLPFTIYICVGEVPAIYVWSFWYSMFQRIWLRSDTDEQHKLKYEIL